jgi:phage baseplate assembly protein W
MQEDVRSQEFLGQGIAWPLQVNPRGGFSLARADHDIEQAIRIILETAPGERVMRPDFGCRIHELVFASHDAATEGLVIHYVEEALERWEPRVDLQEVNVARDLVQDGALRIEIRYQVKDTHDDRSIVYPFYITGEEERI